VTAETYKLVGYQLPITWLYPAMALLLLPFARWITGRTMYWLLLVPAFCLAVEIIRLPWEYKFIVEWPVIAFTACFVFSKADKSKFPRRRQQMGSFDVFLLVPLISPILHLMNEPPREMIKLTSNGMYWSEKQEKLNLPRNDIDITYETAWNGRGYYWDFYDRAGQGNVIPSDKLYWSDHGLVNGDQVAKRIVAWSGTHPRYIINGVSERGWKNPHPAHS
jgi:hypothetical protein